VHIFLCAALLFIQNNFPFLLQVISCLQAWGRGNLSLTWHHSNRKSHNHHLINSLCRTGACTSAALGEKQFCRPSVCNVYQQQQTKTNMPFTYNAKKKNSLKSVARCT